MYDLIILGAGTAGINAFKQANKTTQNILIINAGPWDTTCARVGCMPSKVLISSANRLHAAHTADKVGLKLDIQANTEQLMSHVRTLRDRFSQATLKDVENWDSHYKISGAAHFVNANTVEVNGKHYQAKSFIIAVGSRPRIDAEQQQILQDRLISSDSIFELAQLPKSLAVIGSGVIALELAQAMHHLGVETHIFARSQKVGTLTSPNLQQMAQTHFAKALNIHFKVQPSLYQIKQNQVHIHYEQDGEVQQLQVDYVLSATGRISNLDSLKLENIQSDYQDLKNLPIDPQSKQLGNHPIFVLGDAHTQTPVQHEAAHEGREAVKNCLNFPKVNTIKTLTPLSIVFSQPEMAMVGLNHQQLSEQNIEFVTGFIDYSRQGRALVLGENEGAAEIYVDKHTRKLLGAELFCPAAEHFAHLLAWLIAEALTVDDVLNKPYYHPTLEEGLRTALKHARRQLNQP